MNPDPNAERVPGPRGNLWRDTAIRGHRMRGTGILNNELYIGRLVWNRLRYLKDPTTGRRVSRLNPEEDWIVTEVPELRIIDDALWARVKVRQGEIDASPRVQGIKKSRFWEQRRKTHLLTGLLTCGNCGGGFAAVGKDYVACSAARKLGTCKQRVSIKRNILESAVLDLLKERLMQPEAVAAFASAFNSQVNAERDRETVERRRLEREGAALKRKLDGLYDAIADGLRTDGLKDRLVALETERATLEEKLKSPPPSPVRLHPKLSELYREKVHALAASLNDPDIRAPALEIIRGLIERVTVFDREDSGILLELDGALSAMIEAAQPSALEHVDKGSVKVVAGVGFEPTTFRL